MRNVIGQHSISVLLPKNKETFRPLNGVAADSSAFLAVVELDPRTQITKSVVNGYPHCMLISLPKRFPQVKKAQRCHTSRFKQETRQVIITVRGPLPPHRDLANWGSFYMQPFTPQPVRFFRCQHNGHN